MMSLKSVLFDLCPKNIERIEEEKFEVKKWRRRFFYCIESRLHFSAFTRQKVKKAEKLFFLFFSKEDGASKSDNLNRLESCCWLVTWSFSRKNLENFVRAKKDEQFENGFMTAVKAAIILTVYACICVAFSKYLTGFGQPTKISNSKMQIMLAEMGCGKSALNFNFLTNVVQFWKQSFLIKTKHISLRFYL